MAILKKNCLFYIDILVIEFAAPMTFCCFFSYDFNQTSANKDKDRLQFSGIIAIEFKHVQGLSNTKRSVVFGFKIVFGLAYIWNFKFANESVWIGNEALAM